ncbi:MAG: hypothetical protein GEV13_11410 [Rhodospirillales bacterium]|nr:hypothetical protein [Rhodospirillales bacterium]
MALYEFGAFVLDTPERRLTRQGERVPVTGKTLDVLRLLVEAEAGWSIARPSTPSSGPRSSSRTATSLSISPPCARR